MTTARIKKIIPAVTKKNEVEALAIKLSIPYGTYKKLFKFDGIKTFINDSYVPISELKATIDQINIRLNDAKLGEAKRIVLEEYKLSIMQAILAHLDACNLQKNLEAKEENKKNRSKIITGLKIAFLAVISLIGMAESSIGGFLGVKQLLSTLVHGISNAWLLAASLSVTAINVVLFIAFEVNIMKKILGVESGGSAAKILHLHKNQIDCIESINNKINNIHVMRQLRQQDYKQLTNITSTLNKDIDSKKTKYQEYKEHPLKKVLRWTLTGLGGVLACLGGYWGAASLLAAVAAPLLGTPIGWLIIGGLVASSLVFYLAMQGGGLYSLFNPTLDSFNKVKKKSENFSPKSEDELEAALLNKHAFKQDTSNINALNAHERHSYALETKVGGFFDGKKRSACDGLLDPDHAHKFRMKIKA